MLNPKAKDLLSQGYARIGEISFKLTINLRKGKDHTRSQKELWEQGIKTLRILKILFRHITFSDAGVPTLWRITEEEVNALLACLIKIAQLDQYPIAPTTLPSVKPKIINSGIQGNPGTSGAPGLDATVDVLPEIDETEIVVREEVILGIKTFYLSLDFYIAQLLSASGGGTYEVGDIVSFNISVTSTKGRDELLTLECTDPVIDAVFQPLVNLPTLNGLSQPVVITLPISNQDINKTYTFESNDGTTVKSASTTISFIYPYLYGANSLIETGFDPYIYLTKLLAGKANRSFLFNDINKYFFIMYPASYGTLNSIKDQNGFEKIADFTTGLIDISSTGLDNDYVDVSFRFYRTTLKTTINSRNYTITHN